MGENAKISVLIPVFNRKDLVGEAICSALTQDVDDLDLVVVDNHSDDGTWEFLQTINDPRLRIYRNEKNLGLFGNFDRCATLARGPLSLFLCSDDRLAPGFLKRASSRMMAHTSVTVLSSRGRIISDSGTQGRLIGDRFPVGLYHGHSVVPAWFWTSYSYGANPFNYPSGIMVRTSVLKECLPFRAELGAVADVDMYLRILKYGDLYILGDIGCYVMRHEKQEGLAARRSGDLMRKDLALLAEFRNELEGFGAYQSVRKQIACLAFAAIARIAVVDFGGAWRLFRSLGLNPFRMVFASLKRVAFVALDRGFGYRKIPYLTGSADGEL